MSVFLFASCSSNKEIDSETTTSNSKKESIISFDNVRYKISIARKEAELANGLSGTTSLDQDRGLLFDFKKEGFHSFWMKDMNYSIDIIWLSKDLKVVHLLKDISPETYPETFTSDKKARYVLEINAGQASKNAIQLGSQAKLKEVSS